MEKAGATAAELYALGKADAAPRKITAEEMMKRPAGLRRRAAASRIRGLRRPGAQAIPDKARKRALLVEGGDVKLMDLKTGAVRPLIATDDREAGVRFSFDEKKIVYSVGDNVFVLALDGGELRQMTSFVKRPPAAEPRKSTDIDKWYQDQQIGALPDVQAGRRRRPRPDADGRRPRTCRPVAGPFPWPKTRLFPDWISRRTKARSSLRSPSPWPTSVRPSSPIT